jgi:FAD/FMN-containing dehydrogenase
VWQALRPHMIGGGTYVNAVDSEDAQDNAKVQAVYGPKYARLAQVKATYDPDNVFHRNVNISSGGIPVPRS